MPDIVSIKILTDEGLRLYRKTAYTRFTARRSTSSESETAARQFEMATMEMKSRCKAGHFGRLPC